MKNVLYESVLFGACYVPPERSDFSKIDIFDVIEGEILQYAAEKSCKVCLLGDFNAHTGKKDDFVDINHFVCDFIHLDDDIKHNYDFVNLESLGICTKRYSLDKSVDNYGNRLLLLCKDFLLIANGRLGKDKFIGALTCKEATVVDYCILSPELFTHVIDFEIIPFDPLFSDVHNAMYIEMSCKTTFMSSSLANNTMETAGDVTIPKWENEKGHEFNDCLNDTDIESFVDKLVAVNIDQVDNVVINSLVDECSTIILNAASKCNLLHEKNVPRKVVNDCNKGKNVKNHGSIENVVINVKLNVITGELELLKVNLTLQGVVKSIRMYYVDNIICTKEILLIS